MYDTSKEILFFKNMFLKAYFNASYSTPKISFKEYLFQGKLH